MKVIQKLLHIVFSSFLVWQTIMLIERLINNPPTEFLSSLQEAVFVNLFVTGIFTIVYSFPVYKILPTAYYQIKKSERLKSILKTIRIDLFKKLLTATIWKKNQNKKYFFTGSRNGFDHLEIATMKSEFGHFAGFCIVMTLTIFIGIRTNYIIAIMILIVNIIFNFYPLMLQRSHRLRLNEIKHRPGKKLG